jgi:hypothetical protein
MTRSIQLRIFTLGVIALLSRLAAAQLVNPGDNVALPGTTSAAWPALAGVALYDVVIPFEIHDANGVLLYKGNLQNSVSRSNDDHTLDFYYRIRDTQPSLNGVLAIADTSDFTGYGTQVNYRTDGLGTVPTERAARNAGPGDTVSFLYDAVYSGEESYFTFIKTDATAFAAGGTTILRLGSGESVTLPTVMPVPEPSTCLLVTLGMCLIANLRRQVGARFERS